MRLIGKTRPNLSHLSRNGFFEAEKMRTNNENIVAALSVFNCGKTAASAAKSHCRSPYPLKGFKELRQTLGRFRNCGNIGGE